MKEVVKVSNEQKQIPVNLFTEQMIETQKTLQELQLRMMRQFKPLYDTAARLRPVLERSSAVLNAPVLGSNAHKHVESFRRVQAQLAQIANMLQEINTPDLPTAKVDSHDSYQELRRYADKLENQVSVLEQAIKDSKKE